MPNSRRDALLARSKALRERATAFDIRLKDERAREFMRSTVLEEEGYKEEGWLDR